MGSQDGFPAIAVKHSGCSECSKSTTQSIRRVINNPQLS